MRTKAQQSRPMSSLGKRMLGQDDSSLEGVRVLVVEDTWHVAKALKTVLAQIGMNVAGPVATAAEARRSIAESMPRVAIVDLNLKREMAYSLIEELHDHGVLVIVVSGYAAPSISPDKIAAFLQ